MSVGSPSLPTPRSYGPKIADGAFGGPCLSAPSVAIFLRLRLRFSDAGQKIAAIFGPLGLGGENSLARPPPRGPPGNLSGVFRYSGRCLR